MGQYAGIAMVVEYDQNEPGVPYYSLPPTVFEYTSAEEYVSNRDIRNMLEAGAKHAGEGGRPWIPVPMTAKELGDAIRHSIHYDIEKAEETLTKLEQRIATARDENAVLPQHTNESIARYESAADRALARALTGLMTVREIGFGSQNGDNPE